MLLVFEEERLASGLPDKYSFTVLGLYNNNVIKME